MDVSSQTLALVGAIGGSLIGLFGGVAGTWVSIRATKGPKERAFVIRASLVCWAAILVFLAALFLIPTPWNFLLWLVYVPALIVGIRRFNAGAASARVEDKAVSGI